MTQRRKVDVPGIVGERLTSWRRRLVAAHATPVAVIGIGHDHVAGSMVVMVVEDMDRDVLRALLTYALVNLDNAEEHDGGAD